MNIKSTIKDMFKKNSVIYFTLFIIVFLIMGIISPKVFLGSYNIQSMAFQIPEFGIFTLGMMVTIITGGIDLSIIANSNLSAVFASLAMYKYMETAGTSANPTIVILLISSICILTGLALGIFNGILVSFVHIPAILATLGSMKLFDGISTVCTGGQPFRDYPAIVASIGNNTFLGIPISFFFFITAAIAMYIIMNKTKLGKSIYLLGVSPLASKYSGLNNNLTILKTYAISGLYAGVSGLIMMSRFNSIKVGYGNAYQLLTVLVCVMGGVNPNGGKGDVLCVTFSVLMLQCIASGFNILGFSNYVRNIIYGIVLIIVMIVNALYPIITEKIAFRKLKKLNP